MSELTGVSVRAERFESALGTPIGQLLLGSVPYAGGVSAFFAARVQGRQVKRLEEFLADVVRDLEEVRARAEGAADEVLESDEFAHLLYGICDDAGRDLDERRLVYLRKFLSAATLETRPDANWIDLFRRYLTRLTGAHLVCLEAVHALQQSIPASDRLGSRELTNVPVKLFDLVGLHYPPDLTRICLADLTNLGLLADWRYLSGNPRAPEGVCLTRNGLWFWRFIDGAWSANMPS